MGFNTRYIPKSPKYQHKRNAAREALWIANAAKDKRNLIKTGNVLLRHGRRIEAVFDFEEAKNAASWVGKRTKILNREKRLSK